MGIYFQQFYVFFEEQYDVLEDYIDDIVECICSFGFFFLGFMEVFKKEVCLEEIGYFNGNVEQMFRNFFVDYEVIIQFLCYDQDVVMEEYNDVGIQDFFIVLMEEYEKMVWMVCVYLG